MTAPNEQPIAATGAGTAAATDANANGTVANAAAPAVAADTSADTAATPATPAFDPNGDTVLIAYDGSDQARLAVEHAGRFLSAKNAYILTVWEPIHRQAARAAGMSGMMQHDWSADASTEPNDDDPAYTEAVNVCQEGVELARQNGFATEPFLVESGTAIWSAIVDAADELDVDLIVTGTRALSGWKSLLQSSVSDSIIKNAGRPVLIVPPASEDD